MGAEAPQQGQGRRQRRNSVDTPSDWIAQDERDHELPRALREGVTAMRLAALRYEWMFPNPGELEPLVVGDAPTGVQAVRSADVANAPTRGVGMSLYEARVLRSDLPNPWADGVRSIARMPFRAPVVLAGWDEELAGSVQKETDGTVSHREPGWVDSITSDGQSLDEYAAEVFQDALFEGVCYSFVDNDPRKFPDAASRKAAGAHPRVTKFRRCHVRRITIELSAGGVPRLKQVVLAQPIKVQDVSDPNAWVDTEVDARKVVTAGDPNSQVTAERQVRTQVYVQQRNGGWVERKDLAGLILPDKPGDELLDIPLVPHYSDRVSPYRGRCPFLEPAWTEATIWNHNSEIGNAAREAMLTHLHESGIGVDSQTQKPILPDTRGARYHWSTNPQASMTLLETQGTALKSVLELVEWKIRMVEKALHQIQVEKPTGPVTAREITLEGVQATSALEMWVNFQEKAWKKILDFVALLGGLPKRGVVSIPRDFGLPNSGLERNHQLFLAGKMSPGNYWVEAQRAGDVDEQTFDLKAELAWAAAQETGASGAGSVTPPEGEPGPLKSTEAFAGT